jgi:hypothetical protein
MCSSSLMVVDGAQEHVGQHEMEGETVQAAVAATRSVLVGA